MADPQDLVHFIVWFARERGERLTTLRLVKFLYLADLYFARVNRGRTLTGWPWAFVHYGPFCGEALDAIAATVGSEKITAQGFQSKYDEKDFQLYDVAEPEPPRARDTLPDYVVGPLQDAIRRWADDTPALLDHVYFHTEPMLEARPGERLDFGTATVVESGPPVEMLRLSPPKVRRAREAAKALAERYKKAVEASRRTESAAIYDADFLGALRAMGDVEPTRVEPIKGTAKLPPS